MTTPQSASRRDPAVERLAAWQGGPEDARLRAARRYDIATWGRPKRFPLVSSRRVIQWPLGLLMTAGVPWMAMYRIDGLAVASERTMLLVAVIAILAVVVPSIAYDLWVGGTVEIDPAERELRRRSHRGRVRDRWNFDQITAVECVPLSGATELRIAVGRRVLLTTVGSNGGPVLARTLREEAGLEPSAPDRAANGDPRSGA